MKQKMKGVGKIRSANKSFVKAMLCSVVMFMASTANATTVDIVSDNSSGLSGANYTSTLEDGTVLGFKWTGYECYLVGIKTDAASLNVPDSVRLKGVLYPVYYVGYSNSFDTSQAPSCTELFLPPTILYIYSYSPQIKTLHLTSYAGVAYLPDEYYSMNPITVYVPEDIISSFYNNVDNWLNHFVILAEGTEPLKLTMNMTQENELAEKILEACGNDWYKVKELTVTGKLSTTDLDIFKRMKQLTKLDLKQADFQILPAGFTGGVSTSPYAPTLGLLQEITLPDLQSIDYDALIGCRRLHKVNLCKVGTIGSYAFAGTGFKTINLPDCLNRIEGYAFAYSQLSSIKIPSSITSISDGCFSYTKLKSIELPPSVTAIGASAFASCDSLAEVSIPKVESINSYAFSSCKALKKIDLPESFETYRFYAPFWDCPNLTEVKVRSVAPPYNPAGGCISDNDKTNVVLYVPSASIDTYRATDGWNEFYTIKPLEEKSTYAKICSPMTITDGSCFEPQSSISVSYDDYSRIGALDYRGAETLSMKDYNQSHRLAYYVDTCYTSLIVNGPMRADTVRTYLQTRNPDTWHFVSLPYNVKVSDITADKDCQWVIRKYSGANRAVQNGNETWLNLTEDSTMNAYEGYILRCNASDGAKFCFPSINDTQKNNIFAKDDVVMPLAEYQSEFSHNRSWNLVGNPYPCWYDTRFLDTTTPITIWNPIHRRYDAYSPVDDSFILSPTMAFFIQRPVDASAITFNKEGRQTNSTTRTIAATKDMKHARSTRKVYNLTLSDGEYSDHARFVLNNNASRSYEIDKDAEKMVTDENTMPLLYTVENGVRYAINERPVGDGIINLGFYAPSDGTFTISIDNIPTEGITIRDNESNKLTKLDSGYTFTAMAGYNDSRLIILLGSATGIESLPTESIATDVTHVYSIDGRLVGTYHGDIPELGKGIYVIEKVNSKRKIVVK